MVGARPPAPDTSCASVTSEQLVSRVVDVGPRAVLLSASLTSSLPRVRRQVEAVRGTGTPIVVGGSAFDPDGVWARRAGRHRGGPVRVQELAALLPDLQHHVGDPRPLVHPGADEARSLLSTIHEATRRVAGGTVFGETRFGGP